VAWLGRRVPAEWIYLVSHFACPRATAVNMNGGVVRLEGGEGEAAITLLNVVDSTNVVAICIN